ncbi:MAG: GAF domain-containing protein [Ignavibacteriaceae bacterium]
MSELLFIDNKLSLEEKYESILRQVKSLLSAKDNYITSLANLAAVLKQSFDKISWVGFYIFDGDKLYLGPFQGKVACTTIEMGKGVCGNAAKDLATIIVDDVSRFEGHIACDPDSKSEIVLPVTKNQQLFGVLDIDSYQLNAFSEKDKYYLEKICKHLSSVI